MKFMPALIGLFVFAFALGVTVERRIDNIQNAAQREAAQQLSLENLALKARKDCDE